MRATTLRRPSGAVLVILAATNSVRRGDFGKAVTEDGAFAAGVTAALWLVGGLMVARRPRSGALVLALATFIVWYSFVTLHLVRGATPVTEIASKSGVIWALIAVASAVLAAASFPVALGLVAVSIRRRRNPSAIAA